MNDLLGVFLGAIQSACPGFGGSPLHFTSIAGFCEETLRGWLNVADLLTVGDDIGAIGKR
jgi:hypothetical protein